MIISTANAMALFAAMIVLAVVPGISVITVTARAATHGFLHGVITSLGIVVADIIFILMAIYGLSYLASAHYYFFVLVQYVGAAYLLCLGLMLWKSMPGSERVRKTTGASLGSSFNMGFLITLSDQKAILFYLGFLPAFLDLSRATVMDTVVIVIIAALAIGLGKLGYVYWVTRLGAKIQSAKFSVGINRLASVIMLLTAAFLVVKNA